MTIRMRYTRAVEGKQDGLEWKKGDDNAILGMMHFHAHSCWELFADGEEFQHILHHTRGVVNLANLNDEAMYFVGDWAKMIARNLPFIFQLK